MTPEEKREALATADVLPRQKWCKDLHRVGPLGAEQCPKCTETSSYTRRDLGEISRAAMAFLNLHEKDELAYEVDLRRIAKELREVVFAANRRARAREHLSRPGGPWASGA